MKPSVRRLAASLFLGFLAVHLVARVAAAQNTDARQPKPTLQEIEAVWKKRTDTITSVAMKVEMDQFVKGRGDQPVKDEGPFTESRPSDGRVFKIALEYAYEQGKTSFTRSGMIISGADPEKTEQQTCRFTFDGHENRSFVEQGTYKPSATFEKKDAASDPIIYGDVVATDLWIRPKVFFRALNFADISVEDDPVEVDGVKCRRIRLQRGTTKRISTIDVKVGLGCVPVQYQSWSGDRPLMKLTIKYDVDPKAGPVVKEWIRTTFNDTGGFDEVLKAKVTQLQLNSDIADDCFTIRFPVGTVVAGKLGNGKTRKYIQKDSGLEPQEKTEPGGTQSDKDNPFGARQGTGRRAGGKLVAFAADSKLPGFMTSEELRKAGFSPLTEGDSLDAWNVKPWHKDHWTIKDGLINYDGKAKGKFADNSLWTKKSYGDFEMYAEWRLPEKPKMKATPIVLYNGDFLMDDDNKRVTRPHLDAGDSGLMFRGTLKCQANIWSQELGSGEINGYRTDKKMPQTVRRACIPIKNADRPLGEWNAFLITIKGSRMTTELNGERVIDTPDLPDLPKTGPIGLQHHGDPVQFRQLWVKTLD